MAKSNNFLGGMDGQSVGLALLGSTSAFSIWSAANPSVFTVSQFSTEQSKKNAKLGMNIGLGLDAALSLGIWLAYGKKGVFPAMLTGATGLGLYLLYEHLLDNNHITNPNSQTMAQQAETMQQQMPMTPQQVMCADNPIGWPQDPMCSNSNSNSNSNQDQNQGGYYHDFDYNYKVDLA